MTVSPTGQGKVFLINIGFGLACVLLFDFFAVLRKKHIKSELWSNLVDSIYFISVFIIVLYANIKFNFGAMRYYQLMALGIGIVVGVMLSDKSRIVLEKAYTIFFKISVFIIRIAYKPFIFLLRVVLSPLLFFEQKVIALSEKTAKRYKKLKMKRKRSRETVKKRIKMI